MQNKKFGVIGYGYWGPNLVRNLGELPSVHLVGVADRSEAQLQRVQEKYPSVTTVRDFRSLFTMGVDAVAIATPPSTHFHIAMECLQNGVDVMIEKPMTVNVDDAMKLIQTAEAHGRILMVGHTFEYNPAIQKVKSLCDAGELGHIFYIDTVRTNLGLFQSQTNVIWDLAPHDISILLYLIGEEPLSVNVNATSCISKGLVDLAYIGLEFPGGIHCHAQVSWLSPLKVRKLTVVGSRQMLVCDDVDPSEKIKVFDKGVDGPPPYTDTVDEFHWSYRQGDVVIPHITWDEPLRLQCQEFADCVRTRRKPHTGGENGLHVVKVLAAAEQSMATKAAKEDVQEMEPLASRPLTATVKTRV